jgi:hypothetical protein
MSEELIVEMDIAAPRELVWQALRDPVRLREWFGWEAPTLDEEIRFIFVDGVAADEAAGTISFGEWEGSSDRLQLNEQDGGTRLRAVRTGPAPAEGWAAANDEVYEGWITFFQQLRFYLELHRSDVRRTLRFASKTGRGAIETVGLLGVGEAGSHYERSLSPGDSVSGEVWHWSRHQLGVLVEQWSGGLIVVADQAGGGGTALLTVYGLSDAEFEALEQRWRTWWEATYGTGAGR